MSQFLKNQTTKKILISFVILVCALMFTLLTGVPINFIARSRVSNLRSRIDEHVKTLETKRTFVFGNPKNENAAAHYNLIPLVMQEEKDWLKFNPPQKADLLTIKVRHAKFATETQQQQLKQLGEILQNVYSAMAPYFEKNTDKLFLEVPPYNPHPEDYTIQEISSLIDKQREVYDVLRPLLKNIDNGVACREYKALNHIDLGIFGPSQIGGSIFAVFMSNFEARLLPPKAGLNRALKTLSFANDLDRESSIIAALVSNHIQTTALRGLLEQVSRAQDAASLRLSLKVLNSLKKIDYYKAIQSEQLQNEVDYALMCGYNVAPEKFSKLSEADSLYSVNYKGSMRLSLVLWSWSQYSNLMAECLAPMDNASGAELKAAVVRAQNLRDTKISSTMLIPPPAFLPFYRRVKDLSFRIEEAKIVVAAKLFLLKEGKLPTKLDPMGAILDAELPGNSIMKNRAKFKILSVPKKYFLVQSTDQVSNKSDKVQVCLHYQYPIKLK